MKQSDIPQLFALPFGEQADSTTITTIPRDKPAIGRASMSLGFSKDNGTPLAAGGVPPYLEDMNGILNMLSVTARASEMNLLRPFSRDYAATIGGYPRGSIIAHPANNGKFLICTEDHNLNDPAQNMNGWSDRIATTSDIIAERERAQAAEDTKYPLTGGNVHGPVMVDASFTDSTGKNLTQPVGATLNGLQYYLQIADDPKALTTYGRLVIKDGGGNFTTILQGDNHGNLTNHDGKALALQDDVTADVANERERAQAAEDTKYPLTGGNVHGPVMVDTSFTDSTGKNLTQPIGATLNGLQYYLQIADDPKALTTYGRLVIKDGGGNFTTILQGDNHGNLTNFEGNTLPVLQSSQTGGDQSFWVNAKHGDWISFPKPFQNFWTDGSTSNVYVSITPSSPWGDDNDENNNNTLVATIDRTNSGQTLNMTNAGFRVRLNHFYTAKKNHSRSDYRGTPAWLCVRAVCI